MTFWHKIAKWLKPGLGIKRWILLFVFGILLLGFSIALFIETLPSFSYQIQANENKVLIALIFLVIGTGFSIIGIYRASANMLAPYRLKNNDDIADTMYSHYQKQKGIKLAAIGGGTGLPSVLRGMKSYTNNITAVVTVADDGGSSGRLRKEMGIAPPGDLRNNIVALADDESLLTNLFQYRFKSGELEGHAFGNLFIAALADVVNTKYEGTVNSLAEALIEVERVLNIQGRVLPATLDDVRLKATLRLTGTQRTVQVIGEAQIVEIDGSVESIELEPATAVAYQDSVNGILNADIVVLGPGSLYTSILPNLMVMGIADALRATRAYKIYICNVATQPVETDNYSVAEHVMALENHVGRGVIDAVLANNSYPLENAGEKTRYVKPVPAGHEILQRYQVIYSDLTDNEKPWRHDPKKLGQALQRIIAENKL